MKKQIVLSSLKPFCDIAGLDEASVVERKTVMPTLSVSPDDEMTCVASITTCDVDADGDLVYSAGVELDRYVKNPVVCWSHDYSRPPIGKMTEMKVGKDCIDGKIRFADTDMGREVYSLVKGGFLRTCSIGFVTGKALARGSKEYKDFCAASGLVPSERCKRIISKWTLLENSMVCIPSNPEALVQAVSTKAIHLDDRMLKELGVGDPLPETVPVVVSPPEAPCATVNLGIDDAVSMLLSKFTLDEINGCLASHNYSSLSLLPIKPEALVVEPRECTGDNCPGCPGCEAREPDVSVVTPVATRPEGSAVPNPRTDDSSGDDGAAPKAVVPKVIEFKVLRLGPYALTDEDQAAVKAGIQAELAAVKAGRVL